MKKIIRMFVFAAIGLYLTSLWNKGFILPLNNPFNMLKAVALISVLWYILIPVSKLILFPLQIITMGLLSVVIYFLLFNFIFTKIPVIEIKEWIFPGITWLGITINKTFISHTGNVVLSAFSLSTIINLLETVV
jgi:hypothetical protein